MSAADVSGKCNGLMEGKGEDGSTISVPAHLELEQAGDAITGTVGKDSAYPYDEDSAFVHRVKLTGISESRLEGELQFEVEGTKVGGKLTLL